MQGETVIVRAFRGRPHVRRVWETTPETVYVCNEENFHKLVRREESYPPVGFPREDVFYYDSILADVLMANWHKDPSLWDRLTVWKEDRQNGQ